MSRSVSHETYTLRGTGKDLGWTLTATATFDNHCSPVGSHRALTSVSWHGAVTQRHQQWPSIDISAQTFGALGIVGPTGMAYVSPSGTKIEESGFNEWQSTISFSACDVWLPYISDDAPEWLRHVLVAERETERLAVED